jgi:myosin heavy chain 6/7
VEANTVRGGRKLIDKLEAKVRSITTDLDCEHRWKTEYLKNFRKAERRLKEVEFQLEEEHKSYEKLQVTFFK